MLRWLGTAGAALLRRAGRVAPWDLVASVAGLLLLFLLVFSPRYGDWELLPRPGSAGAGEAGTWVALGCAAIAVLLWASSGRGPRAAVDG